MKKVGNDIVDPAGRARDSPHQRARGWLLSRAPAPRAWDAIVEQLKWAREAAVETGALDGAAALPGLRAGLRVRGAAPSGRVPVQRRAAGLQPGAGHRHCGVRGVLHRRACGAQHGAARDHQGAGQLLRGTAGALQPELRPAVAAGAGSGTRGRAWPTCRNPFQSIVVRSVETLYAIDEALRILESYEMPDAPAVAGDAVRGRRATAAPRRRAGFSTIATCGRRRA